MTDFKNWLACLALLFLGGVSAPAFTSSNAVTIFNAFNTAFLVGGGYPGWWTGAEEIEMAEDAYENSPTPARQTIVSNACVQFINNHTATWTSGGGFNNFNDDISWAVIAFARGYQITGSTTFRNVAKANWDGMYSRAWDTNFTGGGLWWNTDNTYKNAAVNGPAAIGACLLYQIYGDRSYLDKAQAIYAWERRVLLNTNNGGIADGINLGSTSTSGGATTYNQGTFIGAANLLYRATGLPFYYQDGILVGKYTQNNMSSGAGIMPQYGPGSDISGFNGIFSRWMAKFAKDQNLWPAFGPWLGTNANSAWNNRNTTNNIAWSEWATPTGTNTTDAWGCSASVVIMQVADPSPLDALQITPSAGFTAASQFSCQPDSTSVVLTLTNTDVASFNWSLGNTYSWLSVSASNGTLLPAGSTNITVNLIPSATTNLPAGRYISSISLTNLASGVIARRLFTLAVSGGSAPIALTGYNAALLAPNTATTGTPNATAFDILGNYCFFQAGLNGSTRGLPPDRTFTSQSDATTVFQFRPYGNTNALCLGGSYPGSATLTLAAPQSYKFINILSCSANGGGQGTFVLNFTNGTQSQAFNFNAQDWIGGASNVAISAIGRLKLGASFGAEDNGPTNPNLYQTTLNLGVFGLNQPIGSITFTKPGGSQTTAILAVSGTSQVSLGNTGAPAITVTSPTNSQMFNANSSITGTAVVVGGAGPYTVVYHYKLSTAGSYTDMAPASVDPFNVTNTFTQTLGALPGGTYQVYATVTDNASNTVTSATNTFVMSLTPLSPTGLTAVSDTFGRITLNWTSLAGYITNYNVKRATVSGGLYTTVATSVNPFYTDSGLFAGKTYYYVVSAVNAYGDGFNSTEASAVSQSILNFGFEQPPYGGGQFTYAPTDGAWTFNGASPNGSGMLANGSAFGNANAPEGLKAAFVQSTAAISQTLSGFVPGQSYVLTYSAAQRPGYSQTWNVKIDNTVIQTNNTPGGTSYANYSAIFTATTPVHTLSFVGTDLAGNNDTVFLDNVAIRLVSPGYGGNFGFETPSISTYQYNPGGGSWTFSGASPNGSGIVHNGSAFGNPNAPEGVQAAFVQEFGTINQTLTNLTPGQTYTISYLAAQRGGGSQHGGQTWNVVIDSTVIQSNNVPGSLSYTPYSATFVATSTSQTLRFVGTDLPGGDNTVFIDNVVVGTVLQPLLPPAITLIGITNGALLNYQSIINLSASVVTNGNNVSSVQYCYDMASPISSMLTVAPYNYAWTPSLVGHHTVFARVYYNNGSHQDSAAAAVDFFFVLPASAVDVVGGAVTFVASNTGFNLANYQWRKISGGMTNDLAGQTNETLALNNLQLGDGASYQLRASNTVGVVYSSARPLTVNSVPGAVNNVITRYAAQIGLGTGIGDFYPTWTIAGGSLIGGTAPSSIGAGNFSDPAANECGTVTVLTDGSFGYLHQISGNGGSPTEVACGSGAGQSVTYTLPASPNGYNLTNITVYGGWGDAGRDQQAYTISYAKLSAPTTFITLSSANYNPSNPSGVQSATRATITPAIGYLATNVVAVKVNFTTPSPEAGYTGYSELGLYGMPTFVTATNPTNITAQIVSNMLKISWPSDHTGWRLQVQTNNLAQGLGNNWVDVSGATVTNEIYLPISPVTGSVFYRLMFQ